MSEKKAELRTLIRAAYDMQKLRIAFGNRLAAYLRRGLGQAPDMKTEEMTPEARKALDELKTEYNRLADAVAHTSTRRWGTLMDPHRDAVRQEKEAWIAAEEEALAAITPEEQEALPAKERDALKKRRAALAVEKHNLATGLVPYIRTPYDVAMARHYVAIERDETYLMGSIGFLVEEFPIAEWLLHDGPDGAIGVRGCGALMAAVVIGELDPHRARHESSFWRYAGLDVVPRYERPNLVGELRATEAGLLLRGAGEGFRPLPEGDQLYYCAATLSSRCTLAGTLVAPSAGTAGVMLRAADPVLGRADGRALPADAAFYALAVDPDGTLAVHWRAQRGAEPRRLACGTVAFPIRLEITGGDGRYTAAVCGPDGAPSDLPLARQHVVLPQEVCAGPFICGGEALRAEATFAELWAQPLDGEPTAPESGGWSGADVGDAAGYCWGEGRSRKREHLIKRTYVNRKGVTEERDSLTFNPFLKTKLIGVLAPSMMKSGGHYKEQYDAYRNRLEHHPRYGVAAEGPDNKEARKGHRDEMARRFMIKLFLADLWKVWREMEGLPAAPFYTQAKLGYPLHTPFHEYWPRALAAAPASAGEQDQEEAAAV